MRRQVPAAAVAVRRAVVAMVVTLVAGSFDARPVGAASDRPREWPRLHVSDPVAHFVAREGLDEAWELLAQGDCAALLSEFRGVTSAPLADHLARWSIDPQTYLTTVVFVDWEHDPRCGDGTFAYTSPGSRVVRLCVDELKRGRRFGPRHAAVRLIHEMLHTLGLGENPPSSKAITDRVVAACRR